jgi:hypothetical protein
MKLGIGIAFLATLSSIPALANSPVSVAGGDWSNIPFIRQSGSLRLSDAVIDKIETAAVGECHLPGQSEKRVRLTIPFMVQFSPDGAVQQVIVKQLNCPAIEQAAGGALLQLARQGEYRPTGENTEGWYRGEISISSR